MRVNYFYSCFCPSVVKSIRRLFGLLFHCTDATCTVTLYIPVNMVMDLLKINEPEISWRYVRHLLPPRFVNPSYTPVYVYIYINMCASTHTVTVL